MNYFEENFGKVSETPEEVPQENPFADIGTTIEQKARAPQEEPSAFDEFVRPYLADLKERKGQLDETVKDVMRGIFADDSTVIEALGPSTKRPLGVGEGLVQGAGITAGAVTDVIGRGVIDTAKAVTPDEVEKDIKEGAKWLIGTTAGQTALKAFTAGAEAWEAYKKRHPQNAKTLEAVFNVGGLVGLPSAGKKVAAAGDDVIKAGLKGHRNRVSEMLSPRDKIGTKGKGVSDETGLLSGRRATYEFSKSGQRMVDDVAAIKSVNPYRSMRYNRARVLDEVTAQKNYLDNAILKAGNPSVNKDQFLDDLFRKIDDLDNLDEALTLSGDAKQYATKMLYKAYDLIEASDGSALGLLNARRKLDKWIDEFAGKGYDINAANAKTVAHRIIRKEINKHIDDVVENVNVRDLLHKQHRLLNAADELELKIIATNEGQNVLERAVQALSGSTHVGPVGAHAIASGVAGGLVTGGNIPFILGAGGLGLLVSRYGRDPLRVALGGVLKAGGLSQADKIVVIDLLQELDKLPENSDEFVGNTE